MALRVSVLAVSARQHGFKSLAPRKLGRAMHTPLTPALGRRGSLDLIGHHLSSRFMTEPASRDNKAHAYVLDSYTYTYKRHTNMLSMSYMKKF